MSEVDHLEPRPPSWPPLTTAPTHPEAAASSTVEAAWTALECVFDPELCLDVVSLGLVYDVREHHGNVIIEMTLTTPGCPVSESLPVEARQAVRAAVGSRVGVEVEVVWDPPWEPALMNDEAASALGFRLR